MSDLLNKLHGGESESESEWVNGSDIKSPDWESFQAFWTRTPRTKITKRTHARARRAVQSSGFKVIRKCETNPFRKSRQNGQDVGAVFYRTNPFALLGRFTAGRTEVRVPMKIAKRTHRCARSSKFRVQSS